jgi:RNA polymerase sigma-70 factor (ECF subfamily)
MSTPLTALGPDLVRRFAAGDSAACAEVYQRYSGPMFTVALRAVGERELAGDVVQQAFLQAWRGAGQLDPDRSLSGWLFTITRRCAVDAWRKERRHLPTDPASADLDRVSHEPEALEQAWTAWQVRTAIEQLPEEQRHVIAAAYLDGLSQSEVADRLGLPLGTVKSRMRRAHDRLAELLQHLRAAEGTAS